MNESSQDFDIIVSFNRKTKSLRIECKGFDTKKECDSFGIKKTQWPKQYPTPESFFEYLESFHKKEKGWFQNEYFNRILDAYNRISLLYFTKTFEEFIGNNPEQNIRILFMWQPMMWLFFLAKELDYKRLPDIWSISDLETT